MIWRQNRLTYCSLIISFEPAFVLHICFAEKFENLSFKRYKIVDANIARNIHLLYIVYHIALA